MCNTPRRSGSCGAEAPAERRQGGRGQVSTGAEGARSRRLPEPLPALALKRIYTASAHRSPQRVNRFLGASARPLPPGSGRAACAPPAQQPPTPRPSFSLPSAYISPARAPPLGPGPAPLGPLCSPGNRVPPSHWSIPTKSIELCHPVSQTCVSFSPPSGAGFAAPHTGKWQLQGRRLRIPSAYAVGRLDPGSWMLARGRKPGGFLFAPGNLFCDDLHSPLPW